MSRVGGVCSFAHVRPQKIAQLVRDLNQSTTWATTRWNCIVQLLIKIAFKVLLNINSRFIDEQRTERTKARVKSVALLIETKGDR